MTGAVPRVSVVIPTFNADVTLSDTLDSVVRQSRVDWEAVVVDDGSADGTLDLALRRSRQDPRIRVFGQEHQGASGARNAGVALARAPWLVFLDSDDWLAPEHLDRLLTALEATPEAAVAYCGYVRVRRDGSTITRSWHPEIAERPFEVFAQRNAAAIHSVMVRRDLVLDVGGFDMNLTTCEEWDLWQRIARTGARFIGVPEPLAFYVMRHGSLSADVHQMVRDAIRVINRAQGKDPRVARPHPNHADGTRAVDGSESAVLLAVWCAASEAAKGVDAANLLNAAPDCPDLSDKPHVVCDYLYDGLLAGAQLPSAGLSTVWWRARTPLRSLLSRLDRVSGPGGLSSSLASALERRILESDPLRQPTTLTTWMGVRLDIREPISPILPSAGVDGIHCRVCAGDELLGDFEIPAFGPISSRTLVEMVLEAIGLQSALEEGDLHSRRRYWAALALEGLRAVPKLGWAVGLRLVGRRKPIRPLLWKVRREAICSSMDSAQASAPPVSSEAYANLLIEEERAAVGECTAPLDLRPRQRDEEDAPPVGRKAFWEKVFETPDPWRYESAYEQRKYERTLSLLGVARIRRGLELACAEGIFTAQLAPKVDHLIAADISERALERARERCRGHENIEFRQIDFFDDPLPQNIDLIVCSEVLYYLDDTSHLAQVAEKLRDALNLQGRLLTAHAFVLADDPARTGFDWGHPFGATVISQALEATPGLVLERSIQTELYRVDVFRRTTPSTVTRSPYVTKEPIDAPLEVEVERHLVWDGAVARRTEVAHTETTQVPVLLYHRVVEDGPSALSGYRLSPSAFEDQMRFLRRHGYRAITSADLERHRRAGLPTSGRPVLITFDDGYRDFYEVAWPILQRFDFTAEVFLPTDLIGTTAAWDQPHGTAARLMAWEEIHAAQAQGAHFGSHLATHARPTGLSAEALLREGARSRTVLERRLGCPVRSVALPHGVYDERALRILHLCGYAQIFTTEPGLATVNYWSGTVRRIMISGHDTIETFAAKLGRFEAVPATAAAAPFVSVVVPTYNAEKTIDETLRSVGAQTYGNLEILVVDDGSTDNTAKLVDDHARADPRVRLIQQANSGVAAARNRGIAESRGEFIAPIDADDLWRPTKIEKQMRTMLSRGDKLGLVYTWQAVIDEHGRVVSTRHRPHEEGNVFTRMLWNNLLGSGSTPLIRKKAIIEAGGYDPSLRANGAQGCEDRKLYLQIAERHEVAVVTEHLTGYRHARDSMSRDPRQMLRSNDLVNREFLPAYPQHARLIAKGAVNLHRWLFQRAQRAGDIRSAAVLTVEMFKVAPLYTLRFLALEPVRATRVALRRARRALGGLGRKEHSTGPVRFLQDEIQVPEVLQ